MVFPNVTVNNVQISIALGFDLILDLPPKSPSPHYDNRIVNERMGKQRRQHHIKFVLILCKQPHRHKVTQITQYHTTTWHTHSTVRYAYVCICAYVLSELRG